MRDHPIKVVAAGSVGSIMEYYDFALYGYFTPILTKLFFPEASPVIGLIATLGVFASGYLMRPVGAFIFGHIGDTVGRGRALFLSILLMAIPTFLLGCLPTYGQIGFWAPVLLVILRLLQGISVGGEFTGAMIYLAENAPKGRSGFFASFATAGANIGMLLGSGVGAFIASALNDQQLMSWGWRVPFWFGLAVALQGIVIRAKSKAEKPMISPGEKQINPIREVLTTHFGLLMRLTGITWFIAVGFNITFTYLSTYLAAQTHVPLAVALEINSVAMLVLIVMEPLAGHLSDRYGRKPFLLVSAVGLMLLAWPAFRIMTDGNPDNDLWIQCVLAVLVSLFNGVYPAMMVEMVPVRIRMTLLSLSIGLGLGVFGGTAPLFSTLLIQWTGSNTAPAFYLIFSAVLGFVLILTTKSSKVNAVREIA